MRDVGLLVRREVTERLRSRMLRIVTVVLAVAAALGIVLPSVLKDDDTPKPVTVAITQDVPDDVEQALRTLRVPNASGDTVMVELRTTDDEQSGRRLVVDKQVKVLVTADRVLVAESAAPGAAALVSASAQELLRLRNGLTAAGATQAQADEVLGARAPPVVPVETSTGNGYESRQIGLVLPASVLLYIVLITYGQAVAQGVNEEKSSRVVELLLAAVPARRLMVGKVTGIGLIGLLQVAVVVVTSLVAAVAVGSDLPSGSTTTIVGYLGWFLLAYCLYCTLYAAAGALTSRPEDVQQATAPLTLLIGGSYAAVFVVMGDPDSFVARVLSFVPFSAPIVMPARAALGDVMPAEIAVAMLGVVVTTAVALRVTARIYEGSILRFGPRIRLRAALRSGAEA